MISTIQLVNSIIFLLYLVVIYYGIKDYKLTKKNRHIFIVLIFILLAIEKLYQIFTK